MRTTHGRHRRPTGGRARRVRVVGALVLASLSLGGAAWAYWSATGSGSGTIKATSAQTLTVSALATPVADLYPGKTSDLGFTIANPNGYPVSLTKLTAISVTSSDTVGCPSANVTPTTAVQTAVAAGGYTLVPPISVAAGASAASASVSNLVTMSTAAPDGCQGKTFSVSLTFTGSQV